MSEIQSGSSDEFYTGYLPEAPAGVAGHVRRVVLALLVLVVALAVALTTFRDGFSAAIYEFLVFRDFEGVIRETPVPLLEVDRPSAAEPSRFLLVAPGKFGATDLVAGLAGRRVRLSGSLLYRDGHTMIEIEPDSIEPVGGLSAGGVGPEVTTLPLGAQTLVGRIVDSKCYLGIMKPGSGKTHRACATRCISGGVPPVFVITDGNGPRRVSPARYLLLVGADGRAIHREVLDFVDEALEIRGEVVQRGDLLELRADPAGYRRLHG